MVPLRPRLEAVGTGQFYSFENLLSAIDAPRTSSWHRPLRSIPHHHVQWAAASHYPQTAGETMARRQSEKRILKFKAKDSAGNIYYLECGRCSSTLSHRRHPRKFKSSATHIA
jgi:hypothetical protein